MSKSRDIADSAATINYIDGLTSDAQSQINTVQSEISNFDPLPSQSGQSGKYLSTNGTTPSWETLTTDPTLATLTKTFRADEIVEIPISSTVVAPVVSVTKEVPQVGVTNNHWEANANSYEIEVTSYDTTLAFEGFDVGKASFVDSFSVSAQELNPYGIAFNTDGTKMFVVGASGDDVNEYALSAGFDVSTASYTQSFSVSAQDTLPSDITFNTDGTKMFIVGDTGNDVNEYTLSTGFDVSTASYTQSFSVSAEETAPQGIAFNNDGTKMFIVGVVGRDVNEYALSTAFDISTASYVQRFYVGTQGTGPNGIAFNNNGTAMFIVDSITDKVNQYILSTGFDVSTASYFKSLSIQTQESSPQGIAFNPNGTKMFIVGISGDDVNEYSLGIGSLVLGTGSFSSADVGKKINVNNGELVLLNTAGFYVDLTTPSSTTIAQSGEWDMTAVFYYQGLRLPDPIRFSKSFYVGTEDSTPTGIAFNPDGTKMFIVGDGSNNLNEYTLSTAFDVSTASYVQYFYIGGQESSPSGIAFNPTGTKMFIVGYSGDEVNEYSLSTGFDISTASFTQLFSVAGQATSPTGIAFNPTGTKMFIVGSSGDRVNEYTLSTGFNVSTASFVDSFSVFSQDTAPQDICFNSTGTRMFVLGYRNIHEYTLSTGFDVSTASYLSSYDTYLGTEEIYGQGIFISPDETKIFTVGSNRDNVNEFILNPPIAGYHPCISYNINTTYWTDINSLTVSNTLNNGNVFYAISNDNRNTWSVLNNVNGKRDIVKNNAGTWQYNSNSTYGSETWTNATINTEVSALREAMEGASFTDNFNLSVASFVDSFSVSTEETQPAGIAFSTDGTKMFIVGSSGDDVNQYTLSTAFDISTASYVQSFSVATEDTNPLGMTFNPDGTKMFIVGYSGDDINEYTLSTGFNVSTASFVDSFSIADKDPAPRSITFNTDGTKMFFIGTSSDSVHEYSLSTGFDISTSSFSSSFILDPTDFLAGSTDISPSGIAFNSDGTKMFIVESINKIVNEYELSTAFDVSTASFFDNFSIANQTGSTAEIAFSTDGTKMFIVGNNTSGILEYTTTGLRYTNQISSKQLNSISDANQITLGNDLDFAVILYLEELNSPVYTGTVIDYDANILNQGALLGTDYTFDYPSDNEVRINSINAGNYKVRIV